MNVLQPRIAFALLAVVQMGLAAPVEAQAPRLLNILGYGAVGGTAGAICTTARRAKAMRG